MIDGGEIMSLLDRSHQRYVGIKEIIGCGLVRELGNDVGLPDHVELLAVQLQLVASPLGHQDAVTNSHAHGDGFACVGIPSTRPSCDNSCLKRAVAETKTKGGLWDQQT